MTLSAGSAEAHADADVDADAQEVYLGSNKEQQKNEKSFE
jgi:hypothetical protein